jgi:hypothetical protein
VDDAMQLVEDGDEHTIGTVPFHAIRLGIKHFGRRVRTINTLAFESAQHIHRPGQTLKQALVLIGPHQHQHQQQQHQQQQQQQQQQQVKNVHFQSELDSIGCSKLRAVPTYHHVYHHHVYHHHVYHHHVYHHHVYKPVFKPVYQHVVYKPVYKHVYKPVYKHSCILTLIEANGPRPRVAALVAQPINTRVPPLIVGHRWFRTRGPWPWCRPIKK